MEETDSKDLTCAGCYKVLEDPVQLPDCFHILCFKCIKALEGGGVICPHCSKTNSTELIPDVEIKCDYSKHEGAQWSCSECRKNFCDTCHSSHPKDHKLRLLPLSAAKKNRKEENYNFTSQITEQNYITNQDTVQCPICNEASCLHMELLQKMITAQQNFDGRCQLQGHVDSNNIPCELKFFCTVCWVPVCEMCSVGKHKLHETGELSDCFKQFVVHSLEVSHEKLQMLLKTSKQDVTEAEVIENQLKHHINDTYEELNFRRQKIIQQIDSSVNDTMSTGHDILTEYKERLNSLEKYLFFLQKVEGAMRNVNVGTQQIDFANCVTAFSLQEHAARLIQAIDNKYQNIEKPEELQLVLPDMEGINTPPPSLARVGTELKQLNLAFRFKLNTSYWANSIVLTDIDQCLLSVKRSSEESQFDSIVHYHYKGSSRVLSKEFDVPKGRYFLSRLSSGEIVASYSCPKKDVSKSSHSVLYCSGVLPTSDELVFDVVYKFRFPPYGIATTKENNIILCVSADDLSSGKYSERKGLSSVISMSLRGRILNSSLNQPGANLIKPDYVAVSESGEICISDRKNRSIVILNKEDLTIKDRMNYQLPTSMRGKKDYRFKPHGTCYDTYGRIIVADPDNNSVVRMVRDSKSHKYILEPLLNENTVGEFSSEFISPRLVALGIDSRLWVVCAEYIFVFEYYA